jgi:hypothetical protein
VNFTVVKKILEDSTVVADMFSVQGHPTLVMFDSGASHNFVSRSFVAKCRLHRSIMKSRYIIKSADGQTPVNDEVRRIPLLLKAKVYPVDCLVHEGSSIDIILGISWMGHHRAVLDIDTFTINLNSPLHGQECLPLHYPKPVMRVVYQSIMEGLNDIPVVREFLDVFPEDLPSMPLKRDIEFKIELQPGTTSISRRPYKMASKELGELKEQLKGLR